MTSSGLGPSPQQVLLVPLIAGCWLAPLRPCYIPVWVNTKVRGSCKVNRRQRNAHLLVQSSPAGTSGLPSWRSGLGPAARRVASGQRAQRGVGTCLVQRGGNHRSALSCALPPRQSICWELTPRRAQRENPALQPIRYTGIQL